MMEGNLNYQVAVALGWKFFWSKHDYWRVTDHTGGEYSCFQDWTQYDPNTGKKLSRPTEADCVEYIGFAPEYDVDLILNLMEDNLIGVRPDSSGNRWLASDYQEISTHAYGEGDSVAEAVLKCFVNLKSPVRNEEG
jgi:hypothetical protein